MISENTKLKVQSFGRFLSNMVMPNIGAFIAWGFITALFIQTGWFPVAALGGFGDFAGKGIVGPMITYLLPLLIGYTGGKLVGGERGAVVGAITTMGVVVGSSIPMFLGAMIVGPLGGYVIKKFDQVIDGKVKSGFEMLVNNFSVGIIGMLLALVSFYAIGPIVAYFTTLLGAGVQGLVNNHLLPLTSVLVEPAKILFLNNAINHGVFTPLGTEQVTKIGHSIFFLIEANPGPGLGVLLAYLFFGKGAAKQTSVGATVIHFFGGIHEIYFPYVLMNPRLLLAVIAGGMTGVFTLTAFNAGLVAPASPGSIFAVLAMTPKGGYFGVICAVAAACAVSFIIAAFFVRAMPEPKDEELEAAQAKMRDMKAASKGVVSVDLSGLKTVYVACDAGMGSSATGASMLRKKVQAAGLPLQVKNVAINDLPLDAQLVITHQDLTARARQRLPNAQHLSLTNFLDRGFYDGVVEHLNSVLNATATAIADMPIASATGKKYTLDSAQVFLNQTTTDKEAVIRFLGAQLAANGYVEPDYVEAMIKREHDSSTYLGEGIAIPHGTIAAKDKVKQTGIVFAQFPNGVRFGEDEEETAYIVIGIAAQNDEHIGIIQALTTALDTEGAIECLKTTTNVQDVLNILNQ